MTITQSQPPSGAHDTASSPHDRDRTALIFIEFQREWLDPDGVLFTKLVTDQDAFRTAEREAARVLDAAREYGWNIVHAGLDLRHDPSYQVFAAGSGVSGLRAAIPAAGTWTGAGADYVAPFVPRAGEFEIRGRTGASVLRNSTLDAYLRNNRIDTVFLLGFATHVCVESTLREAHDCGLNAIVITDGCAAFTESQHKHVLEHVLHHFGEGMDSKELIRHISGVGPNDFHSPRSLDSRS